MCTRNKNCIILCLVFAVPVTSCSTCQHDVFKHPRHHHIIFRFPKIHFSFICIYKVVVSKLKQREVYFQLLLTVLNYIQKMEVVEAICLQVRLRVKCNKLDAQFSHQLSATVPQTMTTMHTMVARTHRSPNLSLSYPIIYCTQLHTWCNHFVLCSVQTRSKPEHVVRLHRSVMVSPSTQVVLKV